MSRPWLIASVGLAAYGVLNLAFSLAAGLAWRMAIARQTGLPPVARARQLVWLRALPCAAAASITVAIVMPAFAIFEPQRASEMAGPVVLAFALASLAQLAASGGLAAWTSARTRAAARDWLRSSSPLDVDPPAGVPAYAIDSRAPIVALVGVFSPKLVAARAVIDACTVEELTTIIAHERRHLHAHDNLKRWLMACTPDALRWTPLHREIAGAWHDASEDAADDAAARGGERARVDLAALLLKIARLTPEPSWPAATVSPFVERDGLERRVRRLLSAGAGVTTPWPGALPLASAALGLAALTVVSSPAALARVYDVVEALIRFGR